jgi:hypothetical protein
MCRCANFGCRTLVAAALTHIGEPIRPLFQLPEYRVTRPTCDTVDFPPTRQVEIGLRTRKKTHFDEIKGYAEWGLVIYLIFPRFFAGYKRS